MAFTAADVPDQSGRTVIVTGANSGLGFECAKALAGKGARVLLACRDAARADAAIRAIAATVPGADLSFLPLDQADLASVRAAAELASREPRIDVLLNNAGVMAPPLTRTKDGFELQFGVNHLGTFALTGLLLPKLAETAGSRVVVTASLAHRAGKLNWDDLDAHESYSRQRRYADSKLANLIYMFELDRRLRAAGSPVHALAAHPGVSPTELMRHSGPFRIFNTLFGILLNHPEAGAWPSLQAATDPAARSGDYFGPQSMGEIKGTSGPAKSSAQARDPALGRRLWEVSIAMTGVYPGLPPG